MGEPVTKKTYHWLIEAAGHWEKEGLITEEQRIKICSRYMERSQMTSLQFLLIIGGLLTALGLLTLVATSWSAMTVMVKGIVLSVSVLLFVLLGEGIQDRFPKTATGFQIMALLVFSIGLLLMNEVSGLRWSPFSLYPIWLAGAGAFVAVQDSSELKVTISLLSSAVLLMQLGNNETITGIQFLGYVMAIALPLLMIYWNQIGKKLMWLNNLCGVMLFISVLSVVDAVDGDALLGLIICYGISFLYFWSGTSQLPLKIATSLGLHGIGFFGFLLSFEDFWDIEWFNFDLGALLILGLTGLFFIYRMRKDIWISGVWLIVLIMRVYFDTLFDIMPKGLFFVIGGLGLLGIGFTVERMRRNKGGYRDESK